MNVDFLLNVLAAGSGVIAASGAALQIVLNIRLLKRQKKKRAKRNNAGAGDAEAASPHEQ